MNLNFFKRLAQLPGFIKPQKSLEVGQPDRISAKQFLELIEHVAVDDPFPLDIITADTLLGINRMGLAFYDRAASRWWLTPQGRAMITQLPE